PLMFRATTFVSSARRRRAPRGRHRYKPTLPGPAETDVARGSRHAIRPWSGARSDCGQGNIGSPWSTLGNIVWTGKPASTGILEPVATLLNPALALCSPSGI